VPFAGRSRARLRICLVLVAAAVAIACSPAPVRADEGRITVSGNATLAIPNDLARFTFGVSTRRSTSSAALSATAVRLRSVIARLGQMGIAPADITTGTISLERVTRPGGEPGNLGYVATGTVQVTVRDVKRAGEVATGAVAAGATSVTGPFFSAADPGETARRALTAAFVDAQVKAQRLADAAGVELGAPVSIREGTSVTPQPAEQEVAAGPEGRRPTPPPVRPGTSTVSASVTVEFATS
jgi:uncharacterized protein YggE